MWSRPLVRGALCLALLSIGCGNGDLTFPGEAAPSGDMTVTPIGTPTTPGPTFTATTVPVVPTFTPTPLGQPGCAPTGAGCTDNSDCCNNQCASDDGITF